MFIPIGEIRDFVQGYRRKGLIAHEVVNAHRVSMIWQTELSVAQMDLSHPCQNQRFFNQRRFGQKIKERLQVGKEALRCPGFR